MFRLCLSLVAFLVLLTIPASPRADEPPPARVDRLGDPLPADAIARLGTLRFRHGNFVSAVAISPIAQIAAAGDGDSTLILWDLTNGKELHRIQLEKAEQGRGVSGAVTCVTFSPDGKVLAVVCNGHARFLDPATGKEARLVKFGGGDTGCQGLVFAPDGKSVALFGGDNEVQLWQLTDGKQLDSFECYQGAAGAVAFSPDGKLLAAGDASSIRLWDRASRKQLGKFRRHNGNVTALAFAPDSKHLASGGEDQTIRLWEVEGGKEVRRFGHPFTRPATQHFLADYNLTNATVAFTPDGKTLLSSIRSDCLVRAWDVATGKEQKQYAGHQDGSVCVALSTDGKTLVAGAEDSCLRVWDVASGKDLFADDGHRGRVYNLAFASDGKTLISAGRDNVLRVWDVAGARPLRHFGADADRPGMVAFALDGKRAATARHDDETIQLWDTLTGKLVRDLARKQMGVNGIAFAPDGKTLASVAEDEGVYLWDIAKGTLVREFRPQNNGNVGNQSSVAFSGDGKTLVSISTGRTIHLWNVADGKEIRHFGNDEAGVPAFRVFFSPDNQTVATISQDNSMSLWSAATGKLLHKFGLLGVLRDGAMMVTESVAFSPDGRCVAAIGADSRIHLWEVASGKEIRKFETKQGWIGSLAFSPDGRTIASGGIDTTILLWDVTGLRTQPAPAERNAKDIDKLWTDLRGEDAPAAYKALWTLVALPQQSVPLLKEQVKPAAALEPRRFTQLIADLDSDRFAVRQKATEELENNIDLVESDLRKLLQGKPSLEVRQRVEKIMEKATGPLPADRLRVQRALTVLEQIGNAEAKQVLESFTRGPADAWLTREAKLTLQRLSQRN